MGRVIGKNSHALFVYIPNHNDTIRLGEWAGKIEHMKTDFTKTEADAIKLLLADLQSQPKASTSKAKAIRKELREKHGYYISYFNNYNPKANTVEGFSNLVKEGHINVSDTTENSYMESPESEIKYGVATRVTKEDSQEEKKSRKDVAIIIILIILLIIIIIFAFTGKNGKTTEPYPIATDTVDTNTVTADDIDIEETATKNASMVSDSAQKPTWLEERKLELIYRWRDKTGLSGDEFYLTKDKKGAYKLFNLYNDEIIEERTCYKKKVRHNNEYILNDFCAGGAADEFFSLKKGTVVYYIPSFDGNESGIVDHAILFLDADNTGYLYKFDRSCYPMCYEYFTTLLLYN
ncbi:MAG: hypothetical protein Q4E49_00060 [Bacteroidales bacterium]|nr:hypothetical protein [Bacteroidales bacterium]